VKTATGPTIIAIVSVALVTLDTGNCAPATSVNVLRVGPHQNIKTIGEAARLAQNGDTIEIDAADYVGWFEAQFGNYLNAWYGQPLRPLAEQLIGVCEQQFGADHPRPRRR